MQVSKNIQSTLELIGFSDKEVKIYIELLAVGNTTPAVLARRADLNRSTVYDVLGYLKERGLVSSYKKGGSTLFSPLPPDRLTRYIDNLVEEHIQKTDRAKDKVQKILPEIIALQYSGTDKPSIRFFEGVAGMKEAYLDSLTASSEILAYANVKTMHDTLPDFFPEYYKQRTKKRIPIRALFVDNELGRKRIKRNQAELRKSKFIPQGNTFSPEMNIYNNKVMVVSWQEQMAYIIESQELSDLQRTTFELLWGLL